MNEALLHPKFGYYTTAGVHGNEHGEQRIFGSEGDFVTSPELSQMFGEVSIPIVFLCLNFWITTLPRRINWWNRTRTLTFSVASRNLVHEYVGQNGPT